MLPFGVLSRMRNSKAESGSVFDLDRKNLLAFVRGKDKCFFLKETPVSDGGFIQKKSNKCL